MFEDRYTFGARVRGDVPAVRQAVVDALKAEGFGIITEIDMAATMKAKLDADIPPYLILGACNPPFARRALAVDPSIGALLPCNVVLRAEGDVVVIDAMDPDKVLGMVGTPEVDTLAVELRSRLVRAIEAVASSFPA